MCACQPPTGGGGLRLAARRPVAYALAFPTTTGASVEEEEEVVEVWPTS